MLEIICQNSLNCLTIIQNYIGLSLPLDGTAASRDSLTTPYQGWSSACNDKASQGFRAASYAEHNARSKATTRQSCWMFSSRRSDL
jgi:hypothetical protein